MYKVRAYYTSYDRHTGDKEEDYDMFRADSKEAAEKIVEGLDKSYYDSIEIVKVI